MTDDLIKEIGELKKKALFYDQMMQRQDALVAVISESVQNIQKALKDFAPAASISLTGRAPQKDRKAQAVELWEKMNAGTELTVNAIMRMTDEERGGAMAIIRALRAMSGVEERKEGTKLILYVRRGN